MRTWADMAFFWVQQWWALPVIFEEPGMADSQREGGRAPLGRVIGVTGPQGLPDDNEPSGATGTGAMSVPHET